RARPTVPVSDIALAELYTRDASRARLDVGPYSRFGWHHPGPLLFYALAPTYVAGGSNTAALYAGALVLTISAAAIAWYVASVQGGAALATSIALAIALLAIRLPSLVASPWNPHAVVLPAIALLSLTAAAAARRGRGVLAIAALVGSLIAQSDVALVPFVAALGVVALARAPRRAIGDAALVAAAAWAVPIAEQLRHSPGNLAALARFFAASGREHLTADAALATWADAITAPFRPGLTLARGAIVEPSIVLPHVLLACALVAAAGVAAAVARRRGSPVVAWFAALAALSSLVGLLSSMRIEPPVSDHFAFWMAALGLADAAAVAALAPWPAAAEPLLVCAAAVLVGAIGLRDVDRAAHGQFAITADAPSAPNFAASIRQYLAVRHVHRPLVRIDQDQWWLATAILLELDREGVAYAVETDWMAMFPPRFAPTGAEDAELTLAAVGQHRDLAERRGNVTVDASSFIHVEAIARPRS